MARYTALVQRRANQASKGPIRRALDAIARAVANPKPRERVYGPRRLRKG